MLWWVPWCFLRGSGMRGKGQGPVSLPQWGGGASGAGGESTLREGRNALVGPLVLPAWKWNEGEGAGSGLPPSVGRRRQWGRWREHLKGGTEWLWWVPWCFLRGSGTRGKGQGPVSLPQWGGGASGAGGESILREGGNALVGPLVLPAWKWNEGEGAGSGLPPSVGRRRQWGRWREQFKGGTECSGGSLGASCVEVERGGRGRVRSPSLSREAAPVGQVARAL